MESRLLQAACNTSIARALGRVLLDLVKDNGSLAPVRSCSVFLVSAVFLLFFVVVVALLRFFMCDALVVEKLAYFWRRTRRQAYEKAGARDRWAQTMTGEHGIYSRTVCKLRD